MIFYHLDKQAYKDKTEDGFGESSQFSNLACAVTAKIMSENFDHTKGIEMVPHKALPLFSFGNMIFICESTIFRKYVQHLCLRALILITHDNAVIESCSLRFLVITN